MTESNVVDRLLPLKTRRYIWSIIPVFALFLTSAGIINDEAYQVWIVVIGNGLGLTVASFNATNVWRLWLYRLLVPIQGVLLYYGVFDQNTAIAFVALGGTLLGFAVAGVNTPTLPEQPEPVDLFVNEEK